MSELFDTEYIVVCEGLLLCLTLDLPLKGTLKWTADPRLGILLCNLERSTDADMKEIFFLEGFDGFIELP